MRSRSPYETAGARDAARMVRRFAFGYLAFRVLVPIIITLFVVGSFVLLIWLASGPQ